VHFDIADGPRLLVDALRALDGEGLVPDTLNVREPTLDDVFLTLTGRRAEPDDTRTTETRGAA
jgi:ABC-2 type transport system ATP-binding protein